MGEKAEGGVDGKGNASGMDIAQEGTAARDVAERILSRLGPRARQSARTFELLPMVALDADAATMMLLLRMPEVLSIQPDREVPMPAPSEGMMAPNVPPGHDTEQAPPAVS